MLGNKTSLTDAHWRDVLFLLSAQDHSEADNHALGRAAIVLYASIFGAPRQGSAQMLVFRKVGQQKRLRSEPTGTLQAFRKMRKAEVQSLSAQAEVTVTEEDITVNAFWSEKHVKERALQESRFRSKALGAYQQGTLQDEEVRQCIGENAPAALQQHMKSQAAKITAYVKKKKKQVRGSSETLAAQLRYKAVHLGGEPLARGTAVDEHMQSLTSYEPNPAKADVFVVADVAHPSQQVLWRAMLGGCMLVSAGQFCYPDTPGQPVSMKSRCDCGSMFGSVPGFSARALSCTAFCSPGESATKVDGRC